jgi:DNA-binding beta-propeller fold protein YncE
MRPMQASTRWLLCALALGLGGAALLSNRIHSGGGKTFILATGRRQPLVYAIDLQAALSPQNQGTARAIVSRAKTSLDGLDGRPLGDPANLLPSEDGSKLYVVNHHGNIDSAKFTQHGGRGNVAVLDVQALLQPDNDRSTRALERQLDSGGFGALGILLLPELLVLSTAEGHLSEDGGNRISFVDRRTGSLRGQAELALGTRAAGCPDFPVPFASPHGPPAPLAVLSPDASWGCFPDTNGLALGRGSDGKDYLFGANGGTNDVSVVDLEAALAGDTTPEVARIPTQIGPWGIVATPDRRHIIAASRESQREAFEGNTLSIIDVDLARVASPDAEVARVLVGTSDPSVPTRPFIPSITPDGREIIVPNFRTDCVSIVSLSKALARDSGAEVARIPLLRPADADGSVRPARPKGSAVTSDGRYAVISGGARTSFEDSGSVWIIDLAARSVVGTVTGVGNDPYALVTLDR